MTLDIIRADTLGQVRHGFFGRAGGASSGVFHGLNCGYGSSDQDDAVTINRARVAAAMEVARGALVGVHQVHSPAVVTVRGLNDAGQRADAMVTSRPGLALSVLTADCAPILFADAEAGVIGAAHAGWRGALAGIAEATVDAMAELGAEPARIRAAIGPTISQRAYEVGPEFFDTFVAEDPDATRFFANGEGDRMRFDLPGFLLGRLRGSGVADAEWTRHCTYSEPARFFSYRRSVHAQEADYGRLIAAIAL